MLIRDGARLKQHSRHRDISKEVIIGRGILPNVTQIAVSSLAEAQQTELHCHPTMYEVYYILEGEAKYIVGDQEYLVGSGDFVVVPPNTMHQQTVTRGPHKILYWGLETAPES